MFKEFTARRHSQFVTLWRFASEQPGVKCIDGRPADAHSSQRVQGLHRRRSKAAYAFFNSLGESTVHLNAEGHHMSPLPLKQRNQAASSSQEGWKHLFALALWCIRERCQTKPTIVEVQGCLVQHNISRALTIRCAPDLELHPSSACDLRSWIWHKNVWHVHTKTREEPFEGVARFSTRNVLKTCISDMFWKCTFQEGSPTQLFFFTHFIGHTWISRLCTGVRHIVSFLEIATANFGCTLSIYTLYTWHTAYILYMKHVT